MKHKSKHAGGRPVVITEDVLGKLELAFSNGATDREACFVAGISSTALYDYQKKNPEFTERKESLKDMIKYQAKVNIKERIDKRDVEISKWYLERKSKAEFSPTHNIVVPSEVEIFDEAQAMKILEALR